MAQKQRESAAKPKAPDHASLRIALGALYSCYEDAIALTDSYVHEWKYYGPTYGWNLKVNRKGKALFYMIPLGSTLRFGFAVRPQEKEALLRSRVPETVKKQLRNAKKVMEGFPLKFDVETARSFAPVRAVIRALLSIRGPIRDPDRV